MGRYGVRLGQFAERVPRPTSRSTARAAFLPDAPMMPPPGCVLAPVRYIPRTGPRYRAIPANGRKPNICVVRISRCITLPRYNPSSRSSQSGPLPQRAVLKRALEQT